MEDFDRKLRVFADYLVEQIVTRQALREIDGRVKRLLVVPPILLRIDPPAEIATHLAEATRCVVYGSFRANAVLTRVVLGLVLADRLAARSFARPSEVGDGNIALLNAQGCCPGH